VSPDGAWKSYVDETVYEGALPGFTAIIETIHLASLRTATDVAKILTVDTDGHTNDRPRIAWVSGNILQITAANESPVRIDHHQYKGVRTDLRFDPDDPAARGAWLKRWYGP
jgi:hypothetical protein